MDGLTLTVLAGVVIVLPLSVQGDALPLYNVGTLVISHQQPKNISQSINHCDANSCEGRVWMYYGDPIQTAQWGTIGGRNDIRDYDRQVICRQLGYNMSVELEKNEDNDVDGPVWLTNLSCGVQYGRALEHNNILQCDYDLCDSHSECSHRDDIIVRCKNSRFKSQRYHGEVYLCAPNQTIHGMQTTMGLVQLHLDNKESKSIAIKNVGNVVKHFPTYKSDTLCRQMGFTHSVPNSVHVLEAASKNQELSFLPPCVTDSWFDISDLIDCNQEGIPTPCFGCCFNYNYRPSCPGCTREAAIVLSCTYDLFKGHGSVSGNRKLCELNSNNKINDASSTCNRQAGLTGREKGLVSLVTIEAIILLFLLIVSVVLLCMRRNQEKESEYRKIKEGSEQRPPQPNPLENS